MKQPLNKVVSIAVLTVVIVIVGLISWSRSNNSVSADQQTNVQEKVDKQFK